jgi:hypothetical protein
MPIQVPSTLYYFFARLRSLNSLIRCARLDLRLTGTWKLSCARFDKFQSTTFYQHQSVLRLSLEVLGVTKLPGDAAKAPAMWEFFNAQ